MLEHGTEQVVTNSLPCPALLQPTWCTPPGLAGKPGQQALSTTRPSPQPGPSLQQLQWPTHTSTSSLRQQKGHRDRAGVIVVFGHSGSSGHRVCGPR